jgi:hypothetical protein
VKNYYLAQLLLIITIRPWWLPFVSSFTRCSRCTAGLHDLGQIVIRASLYKFLAQGLLHSSFRLFQIRPQDLPCVDLLMTCSICTSWLGSDNLIQVYCLTTTMAQSCDG